MPPSHCSANPDETPTHVLAIRHSRAAPRIVSVVSDLMLHDLDVAQRLFGAVDGVLVGSTNNASRHVRVE